MKDNDHHIRHPRAHLGNRASPRGPRSCAWRNDQFGRGQNAALGWSDPTFGYDSVAKVNRGVAPALDEMSFGVLPARLAVFQAKQNNVVGVAFRASATASVFLRRSAYVIRSQTVATSATPTVFWKKSPNQEGA
jgi:hypothetical protein